MEGIPNDNFNSAESFVINEAEFPNILVSLKSQSEKERLMYVRRLAKNNGVSEEVFLQSLRRLAKEKISYPEKVFHYHQTSLERFTQIVQLGGLLSLPLLKERIPEIELPKGSVSENVMMTRDKFDKEGKLYEPGISPHGIGASGTGVTIVFGKQVIDIDNYDALGDCPTVSSAPFAENCVAVLVSDNNSITTVRNLLDENNLSNIDVMSEDDWINKTYK